jgi:polyisoprenoid-binding protein YceI
MSFRHSRLLWLTLLCASVVGSSMNSVPASAASTPKAGKSCTKAGQKSGSLVCVKKSGKLQWSKASAPSTTQFGTPTTTATSGAAATTVATPKSTNGIDGLWKVTSGSTVGYRVKEILQGQETEGVGRTNAVTGTLTIQGTTVSAVELTADLTTLKSDNGRRDDQVQDRILETAKFPNAVIKLKAPIELGSVPGDKVEVTKSAKISFTLHGVTKDVSLDVNARRNGDKLEITGAMKIVFADYGITNPSLPPLVTTEPDGLLEFLIVFGR